MNLVNLDLGWPCWSDLSHEGLVQLFKGEIRAHFNWSTNLTFLDLFCVDETPHHVESQGFFLDFFKFKLNAFIIPLQFCTDKGHGNDSVAITYHSHAVLCTVSCHFLNWKGNR